MIKLYNTLVRNVEEFKPIKDNEVKMYACGVTPYDEIHLGHARQAVIFDVIRNYFEYLGYHVVYVRNFTDIDDKIINKANKEKKEAREISERYINENKKDLKKLKVGDATFEPKVSDCIEDIIEYTQKLIDNGSAYHKNGEVLFEVEKFKEYGKLSNRRVDELISADSSLNKKKDCDFSLWKPAKPGEPSWNSPWGPGRPGWHIECSVMINKYLGETIDIHGGGLDLIFPHHENEIAQSESYTKKKFVNYWVHNGLVMVDGVKMSKSLGNFLTVKDALKNHYPEEIRYAILSQSYLSEMNFTADLFLNARKRMFYFYKTLLKIKNFSMLATEAVELSSLPSIIKNMEKDFQAAMDDNFNTVKVFVNLSEAFGVINDILNNNKILDNKKISIIQHFDTELKKICGVLHIFEEEPGQYIDRLAQDSLAANGVTVDYVTSKINERKKAKDEKNYELADRIREELLAKKINLMDLGDKIEWEIIV
jgi:cysteinyl-tRNA synthetase